MKDTIIGVQGLFARARTDPEYASLTEEYIRAQQAFEKLIARLPQEEQDIAWAFVCLSDQMNWRMMELICGWYGDSNENRH